MSDEELTACVEGELVEYERQMQTHLYDDAQCYEEAKKQHALSSGGCCLLHQHDCHLLSVLYPPRTPLTP